jgi:hypothetical protein
MIPRRRSYKRLSKGKVGEPVAAEKFHCEGFNHDITAEEENDPREMSGNSLRPMMCQLKRFMPLFPRICSTYKVSQVSNKIAL